MFIGASLFKSTNRLFSRFMSTSLLADRQAAIARLEAKTYFEQLSKSEKLYAHYMSKAAFAGSRIILAQANPRSPDIYDFIMSIFTTEEGKMVNVDKLHRDRCSLKPF
jgi:dipeptidyl-peptidase-3